MDIQIVLDPYACKIYIVTYISKSQRGMGKWMYLAAKEATEDNTEIRKHVRSTGINS